MEHIPVLLEEIIEYLNLKADGNYIDCTLGLGGHTEAILSKIETGKVLGIEGNPETLDLAKKRLAPFKNKVIFQQNNFKNIAKTAEKEKFFPDGIIYDLGLSSYMLAEGAGFSFQADTPLDMRMRPWETNLTAAQIVNSWPEKELADIIYQYGGERNSRKIAKAIVEQRRKKRIYKTGELANIVMSVYGGRRSHIHPATKTFQAIRLVINDEIENLKQSLKGAAKILKPNGRILVISFHEGEDRVVKNFFKESGLKIITKKPIVPTRGEVRTNPRARSAKMRVLEK